MTDTIDFAALRDQLLAREQTLSEDEANGADSAGIVELDQTRVGRLSRMDALQAQQMAKALNRRRHAERGRIAAALKRMDDGEYGYGPHFDHFGLSCAMEVVLGTGALIRNGAIAPGRYGIH